MTKLFLAVNGVGILLFGLAMFLTPAEMGARMGVEFAGPHGIYEARGIYGGVSIGAGLLMCLGALAQSYARPALLFLMTYTGGYFIARLAALPLDGSPAPYFWSFIVYEGVAAALAAFLLTRQRRSPFKSN